MDGAGRTTGSARGSGSQPAEFKRAAELLRALSHPVRLRIIELLGDGELCVKSLEELLGVSQSSVSQHLTRLRYAGLIESERKGHLVCYRLRQGAAARILEAAIEGSTQSGQEGEGVS
jgi:DNA-binding transcriptional ArsR family regulator